MKNVGGDEVLLSWLGISQSRFAQGWPEALVVTAAVVFALVWDGSVMLTLGRLADLVVLLPVVAVPSFAITSIIWLLRRPRTLSDNVT